ncbi:hypothetical protein [Herbidospora daliensis]|uniref:hypothetical protein n=1 Tax=Herbidospora daliensis TaxID=295585 RepID=UPI000AD8F88F|nr:hypothetical protein [Herbidospora daliensis]
MACRDSAGVPYEVTLELFRDGAAYGSVGERCGWFLARLARSVAEARESQLSWSDPDDRFPGEADEAELFGFRYRSRTDVVGGGELRCQLRLIPVWVPGRGATGRWRLTRRACVEAWGAPGIGLRAVVTSGELLMFLMSLVTEAEVRLGAQYGMERNSSLISGAGMASRPR